MRAAQQAVFIGQGHKYHQDIAAARAVIPQTLSSIISLYIFKQSEGVYLKNGRVLLLNDWSSLFHPSSHDNIMPFNHDLIELSGIASHTTYSTTNGTTRIRMAGS
ncbi:hypothetical protein E4191_19800 (plasmid) [Paracoccus liaowanqingii]|uniref:Uncharacterized protein n=1 Tax=Paracoccus liaowanqingii TaxID=2560053 RepID=A0A4Y5STV4_9RHOB|nr:hypothetical protein [Paracoccus liaowanqingii]QDA36363.1 hypothetical protein E4191_19800 [Paracoccus liaowanqingii]